MKTFLKILGIAVCLLGMTGFGICGAMALAYTLPSFRSDWQVAIAGLAMLGVAGLFIWGLKAILDDRPQRTAGTEPSIPEKNDP